MPTRAAVEKLKRDLIIMGEMCENATSTAIMALIDRDEEMAQSAIEYDQEIDEMELAVDSDCLRLLEGGRLEGRTLRFVVAAMKMSRELERVGDNAVEICQHVLFLVKQRSVLPEIIDFAALVEQTSQMVREAVRALVEEDAELAWKIMDERGIVHDEMTLIFRELLAVMHDAPLTIERCCHILAAARSLVRMADLAMNLAEEVIYLVEGRDVRHHVREYRPVTEHEVLHPVAASPEEHAREEEVVVKRHTRRIEKKHGKKPGATRRMKKDQAPDEG
jgi:phosphate transport system protein